MIHNGLTHGLIELPLATSYFELFCVSVFLFVMEEICNLLHYDNSWRKMKQLYMSINTD